MLRLLVILSIGSFAACGPPPETGAQNGPEPASDPEPRGLFMNDQDRSPVAPDPSGVLVDIDGQAYGSLARPARGRWSTLFFVRTDCPISNQYAPEIRRICADYGEDGVECFLVYIDPHATEDDIRSHLEEFGHTLPAILDSGHRLVTRAGATITPEAAVFSDTGSLEYRGRIDNLYEILGRPRRRVTETDLRDVLNDLTAGRPVAKPRTQATGCYIE